MAEHVYDLMPTGNYILINGAPTDPNVKVYKYGWMCIMGDGATNECAVHESMNGASIWKLPVIFVIENNLYGASSPIESVALLTDLAQRGDAYGIPWDTMCLQ